MAVIKKNVIQLFTYRYKSKSHIDYLDVSDLFVPLPFLSAVRFVLQECYH
jgi:hypothetical protein